jgi:hypothetical protein
MRKAMLMMLLAGLLLLAAPAAAAPAKQGFAGWSCPPPRFQIFEAPKPYGGLLMVDTQSGESWQRIIVNTKDGISIRWMKLERGGPGPGETILWN